MNLKQMLEEALANVEAMSSEVFETECIKAGYTPVRKHTFNMSEKNVIPEEGMMSYRHSVFIENREKVDFILESANDSTFQLAA